MTAGQPEFERLDVYHVGFHVGDVEAAARSWAGMLGAGPFYLFQADRSHEKLLFRGEPIAMKETSVFGRVGRFAVELQNFAFDEPNPELQEMLEPGHNRLNHVGFLATDPHEASARLDALGAPVAIAGELGGNTFYWHDARDTLGYCVEVFGDRPFVEPFHTALAEEAERWDGSDPVRTQVAPELQEALGDLLYQGETGSA